MDGGDGEAPARALVVTDGEWAGWRIWGTDPFEALAGPFYTRRGDDGRTVCAFRAETRHMNGGGFMHGGCLMTFADYALFCIGDEHLAEVSSVTASMNCEFVDSAAPGELIEATGEVVRGGRSLVFIRGTVSAGGRPLLAFSGIVKKVRRRGGDGVAPETPG
jgi:uncharacterized protein (TIGR00369 family)